MALVGLGFGFEVVARVAGVLAAAVFGAGLARFCAGFLAPAAFEDEPADPRAAEPFRDEVEEEDGDLRCAMIKEPLPTRDRCNPNRIESGDRVHRSGGRSATMILRICLLLLAGAGLSACTLTPAAQTASWTDAEIAAQGAGEAPDCIATERLTAADRERFDSAEAELLRRAESVRPQGEAMRSLDPDPEPFAEAARARAQPPE